MAIYHLSGSVISRSKGQSCIASAAYRSGELLYDERQDRAIDYTRKQDVAHKEVLLPDRAPAWMKDRQKLWNAVESSENRKDSQLAREFNFALPRELTKDQNIVLAREFIQNEFTSKGMIADLCIHDGKSKGGEEQPHAHVMLTLREVTEEGFGLKQRAWNAKENLLLWRESWAEHTNKHLALNDIDQRIDHRTLIEQGIDLEPQKKIGPEILRVYETRALEHQRIAKENGDRILEDPTIALKAITYHQSTFTHQDLARFINRHTIDAEQFQLVYEKVKASDQIIVLTGDDNKGRLTTKEMFHIEQKMLIDAAALAQTKNIITTPKSQEPERHNETSPRSREPELFNQTASAGLEPEFSSPNTASISFESEPTTSHLSQQQKDAVAHIIDDGDIKCLIGYAGTGKSRLLSHARDLWEQNGYRVHGATLSGIAAENLEASSDIESRTIASRCYYWDQGKELLTKKDILVIDEAGMLGSRQVARVLSEVRSHGAKAVLIGDPQQLQAIEAGAAFRAITEQTGYLELTEIRRQQEPWQQQATKEFALRHTALALNLYDQHNCIHTYATQALAKDALISDWNTERLAHPDQTQIMLSYTRRDAQELNEMARIYRQENNELGESQILQTINGNQDFAINDRIYFLRNDRTLGVKNGTLATIQKIDGSQITVKLDRDISNKDGLSQLNKTVSFNLNLYNHITHGYAATIHKAQGTTVDQSFILASKHLDSHAIYVGMSRHREKADLYYSQEEFVSTKDLERTLSRDRSKDTTQDYDQPIYSGYSVQLDYSDQLKQGKHNQQNQINIAQNIKLHETQDYQTTQSIGPIKLATTIEPEKQELSKDPNSKEQGVAPLAELIAPTKLGKQKQEQEQKPTPNNTSINANINIQEKITQESVEEKASLTSNQKIPLSKNLDGQNHDKQNTEAQSQEISKLQEFQESFDEHQKILERKEPQNLQESYEPIPNDSQKDKNTGELKYEDRVSHYVQEIKDLTTQLNQDQENQKFLQETKEYFAEHGYAKEGKEEEEIYKRLDAYTNEIMGIKLEVKKDAIISSSPSLGKSKNNQEKQSSCDLKAHQEKFEHEHPELAAKIQKEMTAPVVEGSQVKKHTNKTNAIADKQAEALTNKYHDFKEKYHDVVSGRYFLAAAMVKGQLRTCARGIYNNKYAMDSLKENDIACYKEIKSFEQYEKSAPQQESPETKANKIIKECSSLVYELHSCNERLKRCKREGFAYGNLEEQIEDYKNEIRQCVKTNCADKKTEDLLLKTNSDLYFDIKSLTNRSKGLGYDCVFTEIKQGFDSIDRLKKLAGNRTILFEKTFFAEKEYQRLKQEHLNAKEAVKEMVSSGYTQTELIEPIAIRDSIGRALDQHVSSIAKDPGVARLINQHDKDLFQHIDYRADLKLTEAIKKDDLQEKSAGKLISDYNIFKNNYHKAQNNGLNTRDSTDQLERCTYELSKNNRAMDYLHKNDKEAFNNIKTSSEKTIGQPVKQKEFELEL